MDLDKLKVVDLRKELQQRGLDTKGNKAVLVKRLKDAMDKESNEGSANVSVTQASDGDGSANEEEEQSEDEVKPVKEETKTPTKPTRKEEAKSPRREEVKSPKKEQRTPSKAEAKSPEKREQLGTIEESPSKETKQSEKASPSKPETNGDQSQDHKSTVEEELPESEGKGEEEMETETAETRGEKRKRDDDEDEAEDTETRGEKRRREEKASPEKSPVKKREKTPPREDEPEIDKNKAQLSWYDSDLHLQVDKKTFLSAKPRNEGCMGYIWAGARATHGVSSGKICFEVKITDELKWEDPSKFMEERKERENQSHKYRIDRRKDKDRRKSDVKKTEKEKADTNKEEKSDENVEKSGEENATLDGEQKMESEDNENTEGKKESETLEEENEQGSEENKPEKENVETKDGETGENDKKENEGESDNKEATEKMETDQEKEKVEEKPKPEPIPTHYFRVGFSLLGSSLQLGEDKYSFAYESTGKFVTDKQFQDYGVKFGKDDVIGAYLSIDDENVSVTYTVNGVLQPTAITVPRSEFPQENFALFPHVLCRNYGYEINFGANEEPWFPHPEELNDYQFLQAVEDKVSGPTSPEKRSDCEVILMVGLPGSGKTTWVRKHIESSTDKSYTVIGNNPIFERMTVDGQPLKTRFGGSWKIMVDKIQKCLNSLTDLAALRRRNYIIDQTNVFPNAQRRKLRAFEGFKRKAVCVICDDEEHARRQKDHQNDYGKSVPESTMLDLKAQMVLPQKCEWLEEVEFTDLNEEDSKKKLKEYAEEANKKGYFRRWHARADDKRNQRNRDRRGYGGGRHDRYPAWNRPGGGWGRDRRDNRGPPPPRYDPWRQASRGPRPLERERPRDSRSGGYGGRSQGGGRNVNVWQSSGGGAWGSGNSHGGWNAQMYGSHGYGAWGQGQGWKMGGQGGYGSSGQGGYGNSQGGYGGGQSGYGGGQGGYGSGQGYGQQSWNYYGQYGQQQGWGSSQKRK